MATAVEQLGKEPTIRTKSAQIKTLIHKQIIDVGEDVYKRTSERQQQLFDDYLLKHESNLLQKLDQQKQKALNDQRQKHHADLKRIKDEYLKLQEAAIKEQGKRVEKLMNERTDRLLEKKQLDGQRRLDEALVEAREKFNSEKKECIDNLIRKLQKEFDQRMKEEQNLHKENVRTLNGEWKTKLQKNNEDNAVKLLDELEKQRLELDEYHVKETKRQMDALETLHQGELADCEKDIQEKKKENEELSEEIVKLKGDLGEMKHSMRLIMETFRDFIESCEGFGEGQADFVLDHLIPQKIEEFLRN